jgi:hypothetical protein
MASRRQGRAIAAGLGLFAFFLQSLIPLLVAAEISLAARAGEHSVFELCSVVHPHEGAPAKSGHHDSDGCLCPICVALHASPAFTAPDALALPVPARFERVATSAPLHHAPRLLASAPYRSRAPPLG